MKGTLAIIAIISLIGSIAWFYFLNNNEFQTTELTTIKRTTETLAATLRENQQDAARRRSGPAAPTKAPWTIIEPVPETAELPPVPEIEATLQAQLKESIERTKNIRMETDPTGDQPPTGPTATPLPTTPPITNATNVARTINTWMGQTINITVEGFADSPAIFNTLVRIIEEEERLLGIPYPAPQVKLRKAVSLPGGFCGHNETLRKYDHTGTIAAVESSDMPIRVDEECSETFRTIAHEVAHTWFAGEHGWIDEGLANSIENQVVEANPEEGQSYLPATYCANYRNLTELENADPRREARENKSGYSCNYTLGDGIFGELRKHLGNRTFNRAIGQISTENTTITGITLEDVRNALGSDPKTREIIDLWYSGEPEMRYFRQLDLVEYSNTPTLEDRYIHLAGTIKAPGTLHKPVIFGPDDHCSQFHLYQGLEDPIPLEGPHNPLPVGWTYESIPDAAIINSEINPLTGKFSITARVNNAGLLNRNDLSIQVISRKKEDQDGVCKQPTVFSHVLIERGNIPEDLKENQHHHTDQIAWARLPQVNNYQVHLSGQAPPGSISFQHLEGYCAQANLYRMDEIGYHRISGVNSMLPNGQHWTTTPRAEITSGRVGSDGRFEATIQIWDASLLNYPHVVLEIKAKARIDALTNRCAPSDTMGAVSLIGD